MSLRAQAPREINGIRVAVASAFREDARTERGQRYMNAGTNALQESAAYLEKTTGRAVQLPEMQFGFSVRSETFEKMRSVLFQTRDGMSITVDTGLSERVLELTVAARVAELVLQRIPPALRSRSHRRSSTIDTIRSSASTFFSYAFTTTGLKPDERYDRLLFGFDGHNSNVLKVIEEIYRDVHGSSVSVGRMYPEEALPHAFPLVSGVNISKQDPQLKTLYMRGHTDGRKIPILIIFIQNDGDAEATVRAIFKPADLVLRDMIDGIIKDSEGELIKKLTGLHKLGNIADYLLDPTTWG